jgi:hypothetical protein
MSNFLMGANKPIEDIEATLRAATKSALNDARLVGRRLEGHYGGEDIGTGLGNRPAELLRPDDVKAVARLLEVTTPEMLKERYKPKEMDRQKIYPEGIWERDGEVGLEYVLENCKRLVTFYRLAAERGQAVILAIS